MKPYNGINRHITGISRDLTREEVSVLLRSTRAVDRKDALAWRNWLIWLGTYPCKPIDYGWEKRVQNKTRAFLKRIRMEVGQ